MERNKVSILIAVVSMVTLMFTTFSLTQQHAHACILDSKVNSAMDLKVIELFSGINGSGIPELETGSVYTEPICEDVGQALDSGYTMEQIQQDQLRNIPLN